MRTVVIIPTYNERESLPGTLTQLRSDVSDVDVLIVDDDSPDGTGRWASEYASGDPRVHVLHRAFKDGLGRAYIAGFRWALDADYESIVEMDADGSHRSLDLPAMLHAATDGGAGDGDRPDLVIGSRWVPGGAVENWPVRRQLLSRGATTYTSLVMGLPVKDATAGFRVYSARALRELDLDDVDSQGYCFQIDMTWRVYQAGGRIVEVPITFVERTEGQSKMSRAIVTEALVKVTGWGAARRWDQLRGALSRR